MTENKGEQTGRKRGIQVDPEAGRVISRGLRRGFLGVFEDLLHKDPKMTWQQAAQEIANRQQQDKNKVAK